VQQEREEVVQGGRGAAMPTAELREARRRATLFQKRREYVVAGGFAGVVRPPSERTPPLAPYYIALTSGADVRNGARRLTCAGVRADLTDSHRPNRAGQDSVSDQQSVAKS